MFRLVEQGNDGNSRKVSTNKSNFTFKNNGLSSENHPSDGIEESGPQVRTVFYD